MIPKNRAPTHPGIILEEEFLKPLGMTQVALAKKMSVPIQRVNTIITGKRGVTADTALLLAEVLGTSPEFWMNLQNRVDLWEAKKERARKVS
jgi:addiction module HigA family antidote